MEPEGEFCQLHRHRIEVNAVNARLDNASPPIGEFCLCVRRFGYMWSVWVGAQFFSEIINNADEEMTAPCGGIEDFER